jgi:hypothetical protein
LPIALEILSLIAVVRIGRRPLAGHAYRAIRGRRSSERRRPRPAATAMKGQATEARPFNPQRRHSPQRASFVATKCQCNKPICTGYCSPYPDLAWQSRRAIIFRPASLFKRPGLARRLAYKNTFGDLWITRCRTGRLSSLSSSSRFCWS